MNYYQKDKECVRYASSRKNVQSNGFRVNSITSNETVGVTMVELWMNVTFNDEPRVKTEETVVQRGKNGLIIHKRFYYNADNNNDIAFCLMKFY